MSFYGDSLLSSPDPLGMSIENNTTPSPTKSRRSTASPRKALVKTTPDKHVQNIYISTPPARKNSSPTKSPKSTSPWRIRLTVQAEQVKDDKGVKKSPARRLTERTTTITVPLKGGDDTPPAAVKSGRGRPRKSLNGTQKKSATPKPKADGRRKTVPKTLREEDDNANLWAPTPPKKTRGRPRKSMEARQETPEFEKAVTPLRMPLADVVEDNVIDGKASRTRGRQRRQEITPMKMTMDSVMNEADSSVMMQVSGPLENRWEISKAHEIPQMKPTATHVLTPRMPKGYVPQSSPESSPMQQQDEAMWRPVVQHESGSPTLHFEGLQDQADFDPTNEHQEFDTILESEGFSMISDSSLTSTGNQAADSAAQNEIHDALANISSPSIPTSHKESSLHSSGNVRLGLREQTPAIVSSPSVPLALEQAPRGSPRALEKGTGGTPKLVRVVRAGIALQGVLSPKVQKQTLSSPLREAEKSNTQLTQSSPITKARSPKERMDSLFSGFGTGTRRELRAGLRLGEELAKRQRPISQESTSNSSAVSDVFSQNGDAKYPRSTGSDDKKEYVLKAPGPSNEVRYPSLNNHQLPSPEGTVVDTDDDRMSWKVDTPVKSDDAISGAPNSVEDQEEEEDSSNALETRLHASKADVDMMAREAEWQHERETVSQQIEMANKSQVILIDSNSDNEEEEDDEQEHSEDLDEGDIWRAEASVDRSREPTPEASEILVQTEIVKPRRSKLPSPWRRNSQIIYSDEIEPTEAKPTEADLFWQPTQAKVSMIRKDTSVQALHQVDDSTDALLDRQLNLIEDSSIKAISPSEASRSSVPNMRVRTESTFEIKQSVKRSHTSKLPTTTRQIHSEDFNTPVEDVTIKPDGDKTFKTLPTPREKPTAPIDPLLFQKPTIAPSHPTAIQPITTTFAPSSWLSRLTAPVLNLFSPSTPLPPPATKSDILSSSPHEPLCQLTPWEPSHFRALSPLYYASLLYGSHIFPFNSHSTSAPYLGLTVVTPLGWTRKISPADCGIADAFMVLLEERGYALGDSGEEWIDEGLVVRMCISIWEGMVMKGEVGVEGGKGERVGLRVEGDRVWTKSDIDWKSNESVYFERKRREFKGLPSWREMGLVWDPETKTARQIE